MALANYSDLTSALADWLARSDLTDRIPDFISLSEATLNKVLRDTRMVTSTSLSFTANTYEATAPTDMLEPLFMFNASDVTNVVEQCSIEQIVMLRRHRLKTTATAKFFAVVGRKIEVAPASSGSISYTFHYYQAIPALQTNTTNWLMTYQPDVYLYTSLMHAMPFLNDQQRQQVMQNVVVQTIESALNQNKIAAFNTKIPGFSLNSPGDNASAQASVAPAR